MNKLKTKNIIIGFFLLIILYFTITLLSKKETFTTTETVLTSQKLNYDKLIKEKIIPLPYQGWDYVLFKLTSKEPLKLYQNPDALVLDARDYNSYTQTSPYTLLPKGYFAIFTNNVKKEDFKCGFDWTNKTIGYVDRIEKNMIDTVLYGYRTYAKTKLLRISDLDAIEQLFETIDMLILYIVPNSSLIKLIAKQSLVLLEWKDVDLDRLTITYPSLFTESMLKDDLFTINNKIASENKTVLLLGTQLRSVQLKSTPTQVNETFITRLSLSKDFTDPEFKCFGDEKIQSKLECDSPYDITGEPKVVKNIWDKKCTSDDQCPFFKANQNYPNTRGGCLKDGYCEMPLGTLRLSYTKYYADDPYQPFCYQCKNPRDKMCCEDQERLVELQKQNTSVPYTYLKSPDYAFQNDTEERKAANLPTTILLM